MRFTTLIPAYKPKYLLELVLAIRHQKVKPAKIIISDDSPTQQFISILASDALKELVDELNIQVVPGPRTGAWNNFIHLLKIYQAQTEEPTELFHILLDDDIPYPSFYQRHLEAHRRAYLPCVISKRWTALESGLPIRDDLPVPDVVAGHDQRMLLLNADVLFSQTVGFGRNWLGEFSNVTFRLEMASVISDATLVGISFTGLEDLGAFLKASLHGPVGYIQEHLGFFRNSSEQHSANPMGRPLKLAFLAYIALAISARNLGKLTALQSSAAIERVCQFILQHYSQELDMARFCAMMPRLAIGQEQSEAEFLELWCDYSRPPLPTVVNRVPEISVLVPIYNGEKYLRKTLDSLLLQSFKEFEVLCIDDCSSDGSLELLNDYASQDGRIRVLRMESNQGSVPKVLNRILNEIRGKRLVYSSQDDLFSSDWLEKMHARALETDADAVIPDVQFFYENEPERCRSLIGLQGDRSVELSGREAVSCSLDWTIPGNALWRTDLVKRIGFYDFAFNADEYSVRVFFLNCNKVVFSRGVFFYRQDNASAITKKMTYKSFDMAYTFFRLFQFLRENHFPFEVYVKEAWKSLSTLNQVQTWFDSIRHELPDNEVMEAERLSACCEKALKEYGIHELFRSQA